MFNSPHGESVFWLHVPCDSMGGCYFVVSPIRHLDLSSTWHV